MFLSHPTSWNSDLYRDSKFCRALNAKVFVVPWERGQTGGKCPQEQVRWIGDILLLLKLTWAESGLRKIQGFNLRIVPWTSTFPTQVGDVITAIVFNIHPSLHWELSTIRPPNLSLLHPSPAAGVIQGPFFDLVPEVRPSELWINPQHVRAPDSTRRLSWVGETKQQRPGSPWWCPWTKPSCFSKNSQDKYAERFCYHEGFDVLLNASGNILSFQGNHTLAGPRKG